MHSLCLVVGTDVDRELAPFRDDLKVARHPRWLTPDEVEILSRQYGIDAGDLGSLAEKLPAWCGAEGGVEGGRLFVWSKENPNAKYDWYQVGGRFDGYLHLKLPRPPRLWERLLGTGPRTRVNAAVKRDILIDRVLADPPAALVWRREWLESPLVFETPAVRVEWAARFGATFAQVPDDAWLTAVDIHS